MAPVFRKVLRVGDAISPGPPGAGRRSREMETRLNSPHTPFSSSLLLSGLELSDTQVYEPNTSPLSDNNSHTRAGCRLAKLQKEVGVALLVGSLGWPLSKKLFFLSLDRQEQAGETAYGGWRGAPGHRRGALRHRVGPRLPPVLPPVPNLISQLV